jgi:nitrogen-specific signal transduction histidine kinase
VEKREPLHTVGENVNQCIENSMEIPQSLKIELPYDPVIPFLGINKKEMKSGCQRHTSCLLKYYLQ